jgi:molybdate transport system ATP-binding protein
VIPYGKHQVNDEIAIAFSSSSVALSTQLLTHVTIQNQLCGVVTSIELVDHRMLVCVDIGFSVIAEVSARSLAALKVAVGAQVYCLVKTQSIRSYAMN